MQRRPTIRNKLFFSTLFILLVTFLILLYTTISTIDGSLTKEIDKDLESNLKFARSQYLDRALRIRTALALPLGAQPVHERIRDRKVAWLQETVQRWHKSLPFVDLLTIVDARKRVLTRVGGRPGGEEFRPVRLLDTVYQRKQPMVATELLTFADFCAEGTDAACRELPKGKEVMMLTVVMPVVAGDGTLLGAVVAGDVLNKDPYLPFEIQKIFGKEVEVAITQMGEQIASSVTRNHPFAASLEQRVLQRLQSGFTFRGSVRFGSTSYQMLLEPITNGSGSFIGSLGVALSKDNFLKIRRDSLRNILISAATAIALSFVMAYLAARRLTIPVRALARSAALIEKGEYGQQVVVAARDEFGILADSFNRMARALTERDAVIRRKTEDLQELNELLEARVVDRTAQLRMEMGMLEAILTSMVEGVVVTDRKNRIIHFNPAAQKIFEVEAGEILGQPIDAVCAQGDFCQLANQLGELAADAAKSAVREIELAVREKKLKINISPLLDEGDHFSGIVMSIRDVTMEDEVDRMKNEFLSTVSHELKTPLTSMKGSLQFILHKGKWLTGTERELLGICLRNTERLIRLINSILDISKIEAGKVEFVMRPQVVSELLIYALEEIKGFALARNISVVNSVNPDLPLILGDHDRLIQVVTNLLSNAVKFSSPHKVVMISAERQEDFVAISVADDGKMIKQADRDKLFTKFQQLDTGDGSEYGGTGLGLAICREIVEKHGGRIYYHTGMTGGNVFTFTVPVYEESHEQRKNPDS